MTTLLNCLSYDQKMDRSVDFWAPTAVLEKVNFLKISLSCVKSQDYVFIGYQTSTEPVSFIPAAYLLFDLPNKV